MHKQSQIAAQTHYFDISSRSVTVVGFCYYGTKKPTDLANGQEREFLNSTDWKILAAYQAESTEHRYQLVRCRLSTT
jgi:hypothetical protein